MSNTAEQANTGTPSASPDGIVREAQVVREVGRRRTFAIISHPDAGKTTLTEKLLLFGGAIQMSRRARAGAMQLQTGWRSRSSAGYLSPVR
jgi:hypothetical protein